MPSPQLLEKRAAFVAKVIKNTISPLDINEPITILGREVNIRALMPKMVANGLDFKDLEFSEGEFRAAEVSKKEYAQPKLSFVLPVDTLMEQDGAIAKMAWKYYVRGVGKPVTAEALKGILRRHLEGKDEL